MSTKGKKRRKSRRQSGPGRWFPVVLSGFLALALLALGYGVYLSKVVRTQFESQRWALPARVYARPLELYQGSPVTRDQLEFELRQLGYRKVSGRASRSGVWRDINGGIELMTRPFRFWDGAESARRLRIQLGQSGIKGISSAAGDVAVARLEPLEIGSIHPNQAEDRVLIRRDQIPSLLEQALVAVEDRAFRHHFGVNPKAILRAVVANIRAGRTVQGGSTLTQQLVKNFFLTSERSLSRKLEEAAMAIVLERHYSKDEILEAYVNEIFLGQDGNRAIHGFGLASYFFFNKPVGELDLPEIALMVGMIKGPSYYNPRRNPDRAKTRRNLVLSVLQDQGVVSAEAAEAASEAPLGVVTGGWRGEQVYPGFIDLVRRQLQRDYREQDLISEGLQIFTTLNPWVQQQAQSALSGQLNDIEQGRGISGVLQGAVVVAKPQNGEVLAVTGDRQGGYSGFNRALDAVRPIGSLVKPAVFLTALQQPNRYSLTTPLQDVAVNVKTGDGSVWSPKNYDNKEHGQTPLWRVLAKSYNLATVRLGLDLGAEQVAVTLRKLGVTQPIDPYPSLFLGALLLTPLEVAQIYQSLASGGFLSPLRSIREVLDADGEPLQRYPLTVSQVGDSASVYLINRAMQSVVSEGTAVYARRTLGSGLGLAGKTGTTDGLRDSWFAGFSGDLVAVAWVGRDDNRPAGLSGSSGALRVWTRMVKALNTAPLKLSPPANIEVRSVDKDSGLLAAGDCVSQDMPFVRGYAPTGYAPCAGRGGSFMGSSNQDDFRDNQGHPRLPSDDNKGQQKGGVKDALSRFLESIF
jgi:penicillin-binding protein 1B